MQVSFSHTYMHHINYCRSIDVTSPRATVAIAIHMMFFCGIVTYIVSLVKVAFQVSAKGHKTAMHYSYLASYVASCILLK